MDRLEFYKMKIEPFSTCPESRFYFDSAQHSEAQLRLRWALESRKGLSLLIGDIGTGKTTVARKLLETLPESNYEAALLVIIHHQADADWLLRRIATQLGVPEPESDKLRLINQLYARLVDIHQAGRHAAVLIDEAQMLCSEKLMEEFRGLLNLEYEEKQLLSFVFFGLPQMDAVLRLDPPLAQRVDLRYRLRCFTPASTDEYILHRLHVAGADQPIFEKNALRMVHECAEGVPRVINIVCDNALFEGFLLKSETVGSKIVEGVAYDLGLLTDPDAQTPPPLPVAPPATPADEAQPELPVLEESAGSEEPEEGLPTTDLVDAEKDDEGKPEDNMVLRKEDLEGIDELLENLDSNEE